MMSVMTYVSHVVIPTVKGNHLVSNCVPPEYSVVSSGLCSAVTSVTCGGCFGVTVSRSCSDDISHGCHRGVNDVMLGSYPEVRHH